MKEYGKAKILVMDDEPFVREVVAEMLDFLGHQALCASDGEEAVSMYRQAMEKGEPFDAVIMDLTIPGGMGGLEALGKLQEIDSDVVAIVSSGYSNDPVMSEYRRYGFKAVVSKPYRVEDLAEVLQKLGL